MLVKEAMNKNVKTIRPNETVKEAAEIMSEYRIGSLIVVSSPGLISGIVTERDILEDVVAKGKDSTKTTVEEIMTTDVITVTPETSLEDAAGIMTKNKIKKLPVVHEEQLVGIVTASDLIAYEQKLVESVAELLVSPDEKRIGG